jgi:hypothetical protein
MVVEVDINWATTIVLSGVGLMGTLYAKAVRAENRLLRSDLQTVREDHDDIWTEIKTQREALSQNKEAIMRLNASIDRLNEILPKLDATIESKVSHEQCGYIRRDYVNLRSDGSSPRVGGRRTSDPRHI